MTYRSTFVALLSATGGGGRSGGSTLGSHSLAPIAEYQYIVSCDISEGQWEKNLHEGSREEGNANH